MAPKLGVTQCPPWQLGAPGGAFILATGSLDPRRWCVPALVCYCLEIPSNFQTRGPIVSLCVGPGAGPARRWRKEEGRGGVRLPQPAPPLPSRYFCPDLSPGTDGTARLPLYTNRPPTPAPPVPASIVSAQRVKRTRCESINCPVSGSLGKTHLRSLPPISALSISVLRPPQQTWCLGRALSPEHLTWSSGPPASFEPQGPPAEREGLGCRAQPSPPPLFPPMPSDCGRCARLSRCCFN